jgi:hypothetical protein
MIVSFDFGRKVRCHNGAVEKWAATGYSPILFWDLRGAEVPLLHAIAG